MNRRHILPLLLLKANDQEPIEGRTRLQKLMFLLQQQLNEEGGDLPWEYTFEAYDYGPFAKALYHDIDYLRRSGLLAEQERHIDTDVKQYDYKLTQEGSDLVEEAREAIGLEELLREAETIKQEFNDMRLDELIDYVYSEYPEFAKNSVLY